MKRRTRLFLKRQVMGLNQNELGMMAGLDQSLISRAERGIYKLSAEQKKKISAALQVSQEKIFGKG